MAMKILAAADLHLGMKFSGYPEVQAELSGARFTALKRLIETANREECSLFLIAGDLFDRVTVSRKDIMRTTSLLNEFQGELVALLPGNHDFFSSGGALWKNFSESAGDRVLLLKQQQVYDLQPYGLSVKLYAAPCSSKHSSVNGLAGFSPLKERDEKLLYLGIAHGSLAGISFDSQGDYFPMTVEELEKLGLDLWVVGHTHNQYPAAEREEAAFIIPGTPEPDGFDCRHGGKAWLLEVAPDNKIKKKSLNTGTYRFSREDIEVDGNSDLEELFSRYREADMTNTLSDVNLSGRLPREKITMLRKLIKELEESLFRIRIDDSQVAEEITPDLVDHEFTQGSFPYLLLKGLIEDGDPEALQAAYALLEEVRA